jgi:hypothetical protein
MFRVDTTAVGNYSLLIDGLLERANSQVGKAAQNWEPQIAASVAAIAAECSVPNWDGDQASPVSLEALNLAACVAKFFYCYVPSETPAPELIPESDGEVSLSWTRDPNRMFSVSIGNHDKLNYAGRLGGGVEPHDVARIDLYDPSTVQQMATYVTKLFR